LSVVAWLCEKPKVVVGGTGGLKLKLAVLVGGADPKALFWVVDPNPEPEGLLDVVEPNENPPELLLF